MEKSISADEIRAGLDPLSLELVNQWLESGTAVAVYENVDLGHPECGHRKYLTTRTFKGEVPERLPDWGDQINWRYMLVGTYGGEKI
jgi:hypothetical protein